MGIKRFVVLAMVFMHIFDDYTLQGLLAKFKQKKWWEENVGADELKLYKNDWVIALLEHAFSWTFSTMLPVFVYRLVYGKEILNNWALAIFIANILIHALVDDLKANRKKINLMQDQFIHIFQILITWVIMVL